MKLEDSLEFLKKYIFEELTDTFEFIDKMVDPEIGVLLLETFENMQERIEHAIDHVKVDHSE